MSSTNEEYLFNWNDHGKNLSLAFSDLLQGDELVDVKLVAEGHLISAHRLVLSAMSPYFRNMFTQMPANQQAFVFLRDISKQTIANLVTYIYHGEVNVKQDCLHAFMEAAHALSIKGLAVGDYSQSRPFDLTPAKAITLNGSAYHTPIFNHSVSGAGVQYQSIQHSAQSMPYQPSTNGYQKQDGFVLSDQNRMIDGFGYEDESCNDNYSMNKFADESFGQWNGEPGSMDNVFETRATAPKRLRANHIHPLEYEIAADIQVNYKGTENLYYANNKFNKNGKLNGHGKQRWICTKVKSQQCRAMAVTMDVNGVTMMKILTAEHTHAD